jgi:hypothetical protein
MRTGGKIGSGKHEDRTEMDRCGQIRTMTHEDRTGIDDERTELGNLSTGAI